VVSATLVGAGSPQGLPLDAEEVRNPTVESHPQDCELTASKRLVTRRRREQPQMALSVVGDDLYSQTPFVEPLQHLRLHYVLVAKPASHPTLMAAVMGAELQGVREQGQGAEGSGVRPRIYTYRIVRQVPVAAAHPVPVTFGEVWEPTAGGALLYPKSWITDLAVNAENVAAVVRIGRTRWKIENEQFNVQKNHGYELPPNYGHGPHPLSMVFSLVNLLASVTPVIVELGERLSQRCRARESRRELWAALRTTLHGVLVESWSQLLLVYLEEDTAGP